MPRIPDVFRLGRVNGIPVEVHASFFVPAGLMSFYYFRSLRPGDIALGLALIAILLVSVLVHELGHAAAARNLKIRTHLIEINMSGGLAHLEGPAWSTRDNCIILLTGPFANLGLAAVGYAMLLSVSSDPMFVRPTQWAEVMPFRGLPGALELFAVDALRLFVFVNVGLCGVNLLPGFPLDGGRVLFLVLARRWRTRIATRIVGILGVCLSVVSVLFLIGTVLSGFGILLPPRFRPNWQAARYPERSHPWGHGAI